MPNEYDIKEAVVFLQERNPDIEVTKEALYQKIHRGGLPAEKRSGPHGERYVIQEKDLLGVRFRRPKKGDTSPASNKVHPDWPKLLGMSPEDWRKWKPIEIHTDEDMKYLVSLFGELVDDAGLRKLLHEQYGVWYKPTTFKQRRLRGTLIGVGWSATRGGWWYPKKIIGELWWRPHFVKAKNEKKD